MSRLRDALHDAWCAVTRRCVDDNAVQTATMEYLKEQQEEAIQQVRDAERRLHRVNVLEQTLVPHIRKREEGRE